MQDTNTAYIHHNILAGTILLLYLLASNTKHGLKEDGLKKLFHIAKTLLGNVKTKSTPFSAVTATKEQLFPWSNNNKLTNFVPTTQEEVKKLVLNSSVAICDNDPLPTHLVKQHFWGT